MKRLAHGIKQEFGLPDIGIPAEVLFHPMLTHTEKLLYGLIRNLASGEKGCYASNKWLAGLLGVGAQTISNGISNLYMYELIVIARYTENNVWKRNIYLNPNYPNIYSKYWTEDGYKEINIGILKNLYPSIKKFIDPYKNFYTKEVSEEVSKIVSSSDEDKLDQSKNGLITPSQFEKFWSIYPKKVSKGAALTVWNGLCNNKSRRPKWRDIRIALTKQLKTTQWKNKKYIPNPTTWLNQSRWLDDPKEMRGNWAREDKPDSIVEFGRRWFLKDDDEYYDREGNVLIND